VYSLTLAKNNHLRRANKLDKKAARILLMSYVALNLFFIIKAIIG
jgi:hypothetical protein